MNTFTPEQDAQDSVARESYDAIVTPHYTRSALMEMGMQRSYGERPNYRLRFTSAFVDAWSERYTRLTGRSVVE